MPAPIKPLYTDEHLAGLPVKGGYRLRGLEMTRTETFTDAAFAFAVTLLVVSIDAIPTNFDELLNAIKGIPAFAFSFALLLNFWAGHWKWSRRFGLEDWPSVLLSLLLVFLILCYVYPLKFLSSLFMHWVTGGRISGSATLQSPGELHAIFAIYGAGFVMLCLVLAALNLHALRLGDRLRLDPVERISTRSEVGAWLILAAVGMLSVLLALLTPVTRFILPGWAYALLWPIMHVYGVLSGRRIEAVKKSLAPPA